MSKSVVMGLGAYLDRDVAPIEAAYDLRRLWLAVDPIDPHLYDLENALAQPHPSSGTVALTSCRLK